MSQLEVMITGWPRHFGGGSEAERMLALVHQAQRPNPDASSGQRCSVPHVRLWALPQTVGCGVCSDN